MRQMSCLGYQMHFWSWKRCIFSPCLKTLQQYKGRWACTQNIKLRACLLIYPFHAFALLGLRFTGSAHVKLLGEEDISETAISIVWQRYVFPVWRRRRSPLGPTHCFFYPIEMDWQLLSNWRNDDWIEDELADTSFSLIKVSCLDLSIFWHE